MDSEFAISPEIGQKDSISTVYDRVIEALEFEQEHPEEDWRERPELVYIELDDSNEVSSIKNINIGNWGNEESLIVDLYYIPTELPIHTIKKTRIGECEQFRFIIDEPHKIETLRELYGAITRTESIGNDPTEEDIDNIESILSNSLTPEEQKATIS